MHTVLIIDDQQDLLDITRLFLERFGEMSVETAKSAKEALAGTDMLFISTDWEEFRGLSRTIEQAVKPPYLVIDGRRMIPDYEELTERGYGYIAVGSSYMSPK